MINPLMMHSYSMIDHIIIVLSHPWFNMRINKVLLQEKSKVKQLYE